MMWHWHCFPCLDQQMVCSRLADAAIDIFGMVCVLSRWEFFFVSIRIQSFLSNFNMEKSKGSFPSFASNIKRIWVSWLTSIPEIIRKLYPTTIFWRSPEAYSEPCHISKIEHFVKTVNSCKHFCKKRSILNNWHNSVVTLVPT